jgi:hypothetical protein
MAPTRGPIRIRCIANSIIGTVVTDRSYGRARNDALGRWEMAPQRRRN